MRTLTVVTPPSDTVWPIINHDAGLVFYPIFKVAHSSLVDWLRNGPGFEPHIVDVPPELDSFAVVRRPFDRYISSLAQMWRTSVFADVDWMTAVDGVERYNWRTGQPWTHSADRHFNTQTATVNRMTPNRRLFSIDDLDGMAAWLADRGLPTDQPISHQKPTATDDVEYARATLTSQIVDRFYADDVDMWETL